MATALRSPSSKDLRACLAESPRTVSAGSGPVQLAKRGRGEPILAIYGTLGGWDQGLVAVEYLRVNGFRIIAPSMPGCLGTPLATGQTFALPGYAMAALLDALEIDRIIVLSGQATQQRENRTQRPAAVIPIVEPCHRETSCRTRRPRVSSGRELAG